jgi:hypothetical protein
MINLKGTAVALEATKNPVGMTQWKAIMQKVSTALSTLLSPDARYVGFPVSPGAGFPGTSLTNDITGIGSVGRVGMAVQSVVGCTDKPNGVLYESARELTRDNLRDRADTERANRDSR